MAIPGQWRTVLQPFRGLPHGVGWTTPRPASGAAGPHPGQECHSSPMQVTPEPFHIRQAIQARGRGHEHFGTVALLIAGIPRICIAISIFYM